MPSSDDICADLADILHLYKGDYALYQATPSLDFIQDVVTCYPMSSTPQRAQTNTPHFSPCVSANWDAYSLITSTPRSLVTPTSSLAIVNTQTVFSPSPLPVSKVPSLVFPEISPPSQEAGSTPFERQFGGDFSRGWNTQISPVARRNHCFSFFSSPPFSTAGGTPSRTDYEPPSQDSQDSQDVLGRVSLIDKFISAAADESSISEDDIPLSTFLSQDRSSPLSDLSDLTPLSSSASSGRVGRGLDLRSSSPPTSPTVERLENLRQSKNIRYIPDFGRDSSPSHSTRSSSPTYDSDYRPAKGPTGCKRKRVSRSRDGDVIPTKRRKTRPASAPEPTPTDADHSPLSQRRRLPTDIPYHPQFPLFYLRFPASSYLQLDDGTFPLLSTDAKRVTAIYNAPRDALDLYTPRFVKGRGAAKVGLCPICIESPSRGGKGEVVWLSMKFSAYNYHLQYAHGISSVSARPFSPPVAFRTIERRNAAKNERTSIQEGKCHKCNQWTLVESIKNIDIKVKELYWWKHAATCHQGNHMEGDDDFFLDDEIYRRAQQIPDL